MSNNNSIMPFGVANARELQETVGITRVEGDSWNQTMGGLIFQGGKTGAPGASGPVTITFSPPFPKKVLGIFIQPFNNVAPAADNAPYIISESLTGFTFDSSDANAAEGYWFAIGF